MTTALESWVMAHRTYGRNIGRVETFENLFLKGGDPGMVCRQIVQEYNRDNDDTSVLIARESL